MLLSKHWTCVKPQVTVGAVSHPESVFVRNDVSNMHSFMHHPSTKGFWFYHFFNNKNAKNQDKQYRIQQLKAWD